MELTVMLVSIVVCLVIFFWFRRTDRRLPPCPMRPLPVVGHLLYLDPDSRIQFQEFRKRCGDIYSLYIGGSLMVVVNGFELVKEVMVKKGDCISDRPPFFMDIATGLPEKGVIFSSGHHWKEQRAVSLSILRAFGMGKNLMAENIQEEVDCYMNYLASLKGNPIDIYSMTHISTANVICHTLIGHRFEYDDQDLQQLMHNIEILMSDHKNVALVNFFPWLRYIPGDLFKAKRMISVVQMIMQMLMNFIEAKKRNVQDSGKVYNLIDAYIIEMRKKIQAGVATTMNDDSLSRIMFDLFMAGTETTGSTIYWCLLYMLHNPQVQEKVYDEIKENVGTDRPPTIQDRTKLTYLNAVIAETQRLASISPLSLTHLSTEEVTIAGFTLPKGTMVISNLDSVHYDTATWGADAMSFRPERFVDKQGKLHIPEELIPFGIGKRVCLGEAMAKMELFLYLSNMVQRFQFLPTVPGELPELKYQPGGLICAQRYEIKVVERN